MDRVPLIETVGLTKAFGSVTVLRGVNFRVNQNEIVGLVGDNGAGKSTLVKILSGNYRPTAGVIRIKGKPYEYLTPELAHKLGIEIVHQERTLAENQSVWRNIFMGREIRKYGFLNEKEMIRETEKLLTEIGFAQGSISPETIVKVLSGGQKQGIQIARVLYYNAELVIMDEPTIQLSLSEAQKVLDYISELKRRGKSAILISHNVAHVYPVCDRISILDRGKIVGEFMKSDLSLDDLVEVMVSFAKAGTIPERYARLNLLVQPKVS